MKKSFMLYLLLSITATSSLFAATITWDNGGVAGDWEDLNNWNLPRVPKAGDDVVIDGPYTITLESSPTIESLRLKNGANLTIAATKTLTVFDNGSDGVRIEDTGGTLTVNGTLTSYDHGGHGVKIDSLGAVLTVNGTINSSDNNDDGVNLIGPGAVLTVNGTINSTLNSKDGIDVDAGNFLIIPSSGKIYINDSGSDGLMLRESVTNNGLITITNFVKTGLNTGGNVDKFLINNGTITVSGGLIGINGKDTDWYITNNGTIILSDADSTLIDDGTNMTNFGTFKGDGHVENGNNYDLTFKPGSTVAPGTSVGKLSFTDILDFTGVNLDIEINGPATYDQVFVDTGFHAPATVKLSGAHLNLSGTYTPVAGDEFMIIEKVSPGAITGTFFGLPQGSTFTYKGVDVTISYTGGNGNDVTLTSLGPLPIELIEFSAQAMENEVKLAWVTATETNNEFFTIERSLDGRTFEAIATINGNGTTTEISKYVYMDKNPERGLNYYRLKQTDFDGQFSYSDVETVKFGTDEPIKVYPTLVTGVLTVQTGDDFDGEITIIIRDLTGRAYKTFTGSTQSNKMEFSVNDLIPGAYFVVISTNTTIYSQKIIKL